MAIAKFSSWESEDSKWKSLIFDEKTIGSSNLPWLVSISLIRIFFLVALMVASLRANLPAKWGYGSLKFKQYLISLFVKIFE